MCKTEWHLAENHKDTDIYLEDGTVKVKEWFETWKNPNVYHFTFQEFLDGKYNFELIMAYDGAVLSEIKENILKLMQK
ncbi:MAG: hypothetical protein C0592_01540 [Marinilabiliales bacterium]|nr:MAG: hypothetical protein C0592_01540 [Marinilabiliales bacterium]